MKKHNVLPKAMMAMLAVVMLGGCANKSQTKNDDPASSDRLEYSETKERSEKKESSEKEKKEEETEGNIIVTEDVESVSMRFYIGYNIATGNAISDIVPCQTMEVEGEDLEKLAKMLPELVSVELDPEMDVIYLTDKYEITINGDQVITIGDQMGYYEAESEYFTVPEELFETVESIAEAYCDNEVYKTLDSKQIAVTDSKKGIEYPITDPEQLERINSIKYYTIEGDESMFEENEVAYVLSLDDGESMFVFYAGVTGCIIHNDGTCEYVHIDGMEDYLNSIIQ